MRQTSTPSRTARARAAKAFLLLLFIAVSPVWVAASDFEFHPPATAGDASTPAVMRDLAERLIPVYQEADPDRYLANLSALQMVAGNYAAAYVSRQSLRDRRRRVDMAKSVGRAMIYDMYAHAKAMEAENQLPFAEGFAKVFREMVPRLDDPDAYAMTRWLETPAPQYREALQKLFDRHRTNDGVGQTEAVELIWAYLSFDAYRTFGPLVGALDAEDDQRRYTVSETLIETAGTSISAVVIRPTSLAKPLPTLLEFTISDSQNYARECAAHGYVGVVAYARGKGKIPRRVVPYQHDGDDARAVINWIAKQPWSDGRVGMYGDGYSGFTAWAAAKRPPPALKAISTSASNAPGINFPMAGNIFQNSAYRWSSRVTNTKAADEHSYDDDALWRALDQKWYRSGKRYRDMGSLYGKPNPIFIRWLNHPSYDRYWQKMVPYRKEFALINMPVLTTTGYYAASEPGDLYYFTEHLRYNPHADHTLVIGPYDDKMMQHKPAAALHGYQLDAAALADLHELRFQWFDHVLNGGTPPALLKDRVNYEVMGANEWRHAPSLEAMATASLRFYLEATAGPSQRLTQRKKMDAVKQTPSAAKHMPSAVKHTPSAAQAASTAKQTASFVKQTVSFVDRTDAGWTPPAALVGKSPEIHNGTLFLSERMTKPTEFNGLFSGRLDFAVNKMDMDVTIALYELLANGNYVRLFGPSYDFRASYARDRVHRHLLKAGERQTLMFKSERITSRRLETGSRLALVLGINKRPDREINYGLGNDVSEESLADGRIPLKIRWYGDSYLDIPVRR